MKYIYIDESEFSAPDKHVGYGALTTNFPVEQSWIDEALKNLTDDPDRKNDSVQVQNMDETTLANGYFHASDDSKNAHSHLCQVINQRLQGFFFGEVFEWEKLHKQRQQKNDLFEHLASLSLMHTLYTKDEVHLFAESRPQFNLENWYSTFERNRAATIYEAPFRPVFFPKVSLAPINKLNPGGQIVDFLLWTVNRHLGGDSKWLNRINTAVKIELKVGDGYWKGHTLCIHSDLPKPPTEYSIKSLPDDSKITHSLHSRA